MICLQDIYEKQKLLSNGLSDSHHCNTIKCSWLFIVDIISFFFPLDINECLDPNRCHNSATCTNTIGSFKCQCNTGFSGDGTSCVSK